MPPEIRLSPYFYLIQRYFPPDQWQNANCITIEECPSQNPAYINTDQGLIDCGNGPVQSKSYGLFQILDACFDPSLTPTSPFTTEQWAQVLDPNINTWMASVIWSAGGWIRWTTCDVCGIRDVPGGVIPYPDAPLLVPPPPELTVTNPMIPIIAVGVGIGVFILLERGRR